MENRGGWRLASATPQQRIWYHGLCRGWRWGNRSSISGLDPSPTPFTRTWILFPIPLRNCSSSYSWERVEKRVDDGNEVGSLFPRTLYGIGIIEMGSERGFLGFFTDLDSLSIFHESIPVANCWFVATPGLNSWEYHNYLKVLVLICSLIFLWSVRFFFILKINLNLTVNMKV